MQPRKSSRPFCIRATYETALLEGHLGRENGHYRDDHGGKRALRNYRAHFYGDPPHSENDEP